MTFHLFGNLITARGIAANNRSENEGNRSTLPKIFWGDKLHVTVSAEAIRWAIRYYWQNVGLELNRQWIEIDQNLKFGLNFDATQFIDDDVLGFMDAKQNGTVKRRGALEVTRAVSLASADKIEVTFNSRSGSKGKKDDKSEESEKARTSLYACENITTRFQYGFGITPQRLIKPERIIHVVEALTKLANVGGNHARFFYDFSPESTVFRWTHHPVPQFLLCFDDDNDEVLSSSRLVQLVESEEIPGSELWICGGYAFTEEAKNLQKKFNVNLYPSIRKGTENLLQRITSDLGIGTTDKKTKKAS